MPLTQLAPPYPIFTDKNGDPLDAGYLYFGTINLNPETNPIQVYYDSALTQPAAQPLRTSNGYVMRNGSPALIYANSQFSVTVRNKNNELVIYSPVGFGIIPGTPYSTDQVTYNQGGTGAITRILTARLRDYVSVKDFGAVGDGVTDDTAALQAAITASSGDALVIPSGNYLVSSTITLSGCTIIAYGAKISSTVSNDDTLYGNASNIKIYGLEIEGLGNASYAANEFLVNIEGTNNSPSAPTFVENIEIVDCYLHSVGRAAVRLKYVRNSKVCGNRIEDVGRSGVEAASVQYSEFNENIVRGMSPGDGSNAYGIFLSKVDGSNTVEPQCLHCTVNGNIVEDNLIWEALDTHGGEFITFANNTIRNCKIGIALVSADDGAGNGIPPKHCSVSGNVMQGINRSGLTGSYGLNIAGESGFSLENCSIVGNVIDAFGNQSSSTSGAIRLASSDNVVVSGNVVKRAGCNCIVLNSNVANVNISTNTLQDAWSDTEITRGVYVQGTSNTGYIGNNTISRVTTGLGTNVMQRGIDFGAGASNAFVTGPNRNTATTPYSNTGNGVLTVPTVQNGSSTVTVSTGVATQTFSVTFPQAFNGTPRVVATTEQESTGANSVAVVSVTNTTTTGCDIVVATSDRTNFASAYSVSVYWIATGF